MRLLRRSGIPMLGGLLVMASLAGWGRPTGTSVGDVQQPDAALVVRRLTHPPAPGGTARSAGAARTSAVTALPADFGRVMRYRPVLDDGHLVRADGSCSSPFGPTGYGFDDACRAHDLGYDLLRYADREGHPLGPWARHAVDDTFDRALHARCSTVVCDATAALYSGAVRFNTWRQGAGVPVTERPTRTLLALLAGLVAALLLSGSGTSVGRRPGDVRPGQNRPAREALAVAGRGAATVTPR
jgi:hypothetical protein